MNARYWLENASSHSPRKQGGPEPTPSSEVFQQHKEQSLNMEIIVSKTIACSYHSGQTVNVFRSPRAACSIQASRASV